MKTMREVVSEAIAEIAVSRDCKGDANWTPLQEAFTNDELVIRTLTGVMEQLANGGALLLMCSLDAELRSLFRLVLVLGFETGRLVQMHGVVEQAEEKCQ